MPLYFLDPAIGPLARWVQVPAQTTVSLWKAPVTQLPPNIRPFGAQLSQKHPDQRLLSMDLPGSNPVLAPVDATVTQVNSTSAFLETTRFNLRFQHDLHNLSRILVKPGQKLRQHQAIGIPNAPGLRWTVKVELTEAKGAILHRWNKLLFKYPGHARIQSQLAQWLLDQDNPEWEHLLGTLERGGGLEPAQAALAEIGEKGEQVSRAITSTIAQTAQTVVQTAVDSARFGADSLGALSDQSDNTTTWWLMGGLLLVGAGGYLTWRILR